MKTRLIVTLALAGLLVVPTVLAQTVNEVPVVETVKQKAPVGNEKDKKVFVPAPTTPSTTTVIVPTPSTTKVVTPAVTPPITTGAPTVIKHLVYTGSDSLATGDPLGNNAVSAKDDAGPPLTQRLPYGQSCSHDACVRAQRRWNSSGTWRDDKAAGVSKGWGGESKSGGSSSSPTKGESNY